jgi:hypothetical protein
VFLGTDKKGDSGVGGSGSGIGLGCGVLVEAVLRDKFEHLVGCGVRCGRVVAGGW